MKQTRRRTKLVKPWLQVQIGLGCLVIVTVVVVVQGVNLSHTLTRVAANLDLDASGTVDSADLDAMTGLFYGDDWAGDLDGDGRVNFSDLSLFLDPSIDTNWTVDALNAGSVLGFSFSGFEFLEGAADSEDYGI